MTDEQFRKATSLRSDIEKLEQILMRSERAGEDSALAHTFANEAHYIPKDLKKMIHMQFKVCMQNRLQEVKDELAKL